jgi:cytochrome c-type biogenesis protein CcmH
MALAVAAMLILALRRSPQVLEQAAQFDRQVYRDQLREIERDLARSVIGADEAQRLRAEIARRLLDADRAVTANPEVIANVGPNSPGVMAVVALVVAAGFGIYSQLGQPGYSDRPLSARLLLADELRAERFSQTEMEARLPTWQPETTVDPDFLALVEKLRDAVIKRPDDLQGQTLLARNEAGLGNFAAARKAQAQVVALKGGDATLEERLQQATLMIQASAGRVSPETEALFRDVLERAPDNDTALFFLGITHMQLERPDLAFGYWKRLVDIAPADSNWLPEVRGRIEVLAQLAGVRYNLPDARALPGPTADDIAAAQDLSPQDREAMIRGMVEGLSDRLATQGGSAEEWARLITALANLGETERAQAIFAESEKTFLKNPQEMTVILDAAIEAGLIK